MSSFNDIKKVSYTDNRDSIVALKEYILFKDEVKKQQLILFKFQNNLNQELHKMTFDVMQYDSDNFMIRKTTINYEDFIVGRGEMFVPKLKMEADIFCETIQIELTYAKFERVEYVDGKMKPIPYTISEFRNNKEEEIKPSKKELKALEKRRIKDIKNSEKINKRKIEVSDVTNRNKPFATAFITGFLSFCLLAFVIATAVVFFVKTPYFVKGNYKYEKIDDNNVSICKYYGNNRNVTIPSKCDDYTVTSISKKAFKGSNIREVTFESYMNVGESAFEGCTKLSTINGANFITIVGNCAFRSCKSLTTFSSDSCELICVQAFDNCKSLTEVYAPKAMVEELAFARDMNLSVLNIKDTYSSKLSDLFTDDSIGVTDFTFSKKEIQRGYFENMHTIKKISFNGDTPNIEFGVLSDLSLENYYINETVETLNGEILAIKPNEDGVITLPNTIKSKEKAFKYLETYKGIIHGIITEMDEKIERSDLSSFTSLNSFGISMHGSAEHNVISNNNSIKKIYWNSQSNINDVLLLPGSVEKVVIGSNDEPYIELDSQFAGLGDYNITCVDVLNVYKISSYSLIDLNNLAYLYVPSEFYIDLNEFGVSHSLTNLIVKQVEENTEMYVYVNGYDNLNGITIPYNIKKLNMSINNSNLGSLTIPSSVEEITGNVNKGDTYFISNCPISNIYLGEKVKTIGDRFLHDCGNINYIEFPNSIEEIGSYAFNGCSNLWNVNLYDNLKRVGNHLVNNMTTGVSLGKNVEYIDTPLIGENCWINYLTVPFMGKEKNDSISFSSFNLSAANTSMLTIFGDLNITSGSFSDCINLNSLIVYGTTKGLKSGVFANCTNLYNISINGEFEGCYFYELFESGKYLSRVLIKTTSAIKSKFFDGMKIDVLAIDSYNMLVTDSFTNCSIYNLYIGKNGNTTALNLKTFYDNTFNYVNVLYLGIDKPSVSDGYDVYGNTSLNSFADMHGMREFIQPY